MGSLSVHKSESESTKDFLIREIFQKDIDSGKCTIVDTATIYGGHYCFIVKYSPETVKGFKIDHYFEPDSDGSVTFATVVKVAKSSGYHNFNYKIMDEYVHPYYYPGKKVLKYLSKPTERNKDSVAWRDNILSIAANKKEKNKIIPGVTKILLKSPVYICGKPVSKFSATLGWHKGKQILCWQPENSGQAFRLNRSTVLEATIIE